MTQNPACIVIAGPNGSGKTTITEDLIKHQWAADCEYINPDNIANDKFGDWNSTEAVQKAANHAEQLRIQAFNDRRSFAFETVFSHSSKIETILKAKELGYFVRLFFVGTNDPKINAGRVAARVMNGGHDVPITKIIDRFYKSHQNAACVSQFVDRAYFYDNSIENTNAVLQFRMASGEVARVSKQLQPWASEMLSTFNEPDNPIGLIARPR